jgi:hypothetical protein
MERLGRVVPYMENTPCTSVVSVGYHRWCVKWRGFERHCLVHAVCHSERGCLPLLSLSHMYHMTIGWFHRAEVLPPLAPFFLGLLGHLVVVLVEYVGRYVCPVGDDLLRHVVLQEVSDSFRRAVGTP